MKMRPRWLTAERCLMACILALQAVWMVTATRREQRREQELQALHRRIDSLSAFVARGSDVQSELLQDIFGGGPPPWLQPVAAPPFPDAALPLSGLESLHRRMDRVLGDALADLDRMAAWFNADDGWERMASSPAIDMRERQDDYVVVFSLPNGVDPEGLAVTLEDRILTVSAPLSYSGDFSAGGGVFRRQVRMPGPVGAFEKARANLSDRMLKIVVPKADGADASPRSMRLM